MQCDLHEMVGRLGFAGQSPYSDWSVQRLPPTQRESISMRDERLSKYVEEKTQIGTFFCSSSFVSFPYEPKCIFIIITIIIFET